MLPNFASPINHGLKNLQVPDEEIEVSTVMLIWRVARVIYCICLKLSASIFCSKNKDLTNNARGSLVLAVSCSIHCDCGTMMSITF